MANVRRGFRRRNPPGGVPKLNPREEYALEKFALGHTWNDPRNAAALACELIRWATPSRMWVASNDPLIDALDEHLGAETPINVDGDPYRAAGEPGERRVCADPPGVIWARSEIANILTMVMQYVDGQPVDVPSDYGSPEEHRLTRLYWYVREIAQRVIVQTTQAGDAVYALIFAAEQAKADLDREEVTECPAAVAARVAWMSIGSAAREACEFLRFHASSNQTVGLPDGAGGGTLHRISLHLVDTGKPLEQITARMFHWRAKDALKGKMLTPELDANLRPAFEAAWMAAQYEFAYSLLADIDVLVEASP